jgi:hypothetical protein
LSSLATIVNPALAGTLGRFAPGGAVRDRHGSRFDDVLRWYETERGTDRARLNAVVLVRIEQAAPLVSPAYADGSSEATIEQRSLAMFGLTRRVNSSEARS